MPKSSFHTHFCFAASQRSFFGSGSGSTYLERTSDYDKRDRRDLIELVLSRVQSMSFFFEDSVGTFHLDEETYAIKLRTVEGGKFGTEPAKF